MPLKALRILAVGRLRTPHWKAAAAQYEERLKHWCTLKHDSVPDADAALEPAIRSAKESASLLAALAPEDLLICLDEHGKAYPSREFSALLSRIGEDTNRRPCFVIGGAYGLTDAILSRAQHRIAFGPLTLPHELARVILLEQLYRAQSIERRLPYHHD